MMLDFNTARKGLTLYNSETRQKEPFRALSEKHVKMYTCGPTVYHFAHIGNFRTYVFEDLLRRSLKFFGFQVEQAMNLTDVDDKTIRGAIAEKKSLEAYTEPYIRAFFDDIKTLNIEPAEHYPRATDYIPEMIAMIEGLIKKGVAYKGADESVYFAISKFPRYGCLSHLKLEELQVGGSERVSQDEYEKENASDFVLWKAYDSERDGQIYWDSPFGKGRPGWHLECSAMAMHILGTTIDIHLGGVDNLFPHHENEIAQSEAFSGKTFVKLWMHAEHLIVDGKKMSKSLGNFYTLRDLLNKGYKGEQVRYMLLHTHYKTQLNFTMSGLDSVKSSLLRLQDFIGRMQEVEEKEIEKSSSSGVQASLQKAFNAFSEALADDLNISEALAALFDLVREINALADLGISSKEAASTLSLLERFNAVLGVLSFDKKEEEIPQDLKCALEERILARKERNWSLADQLRDKIYSRGYVIEDTQLGVRLKRR